MMTRRFDSSCHTPGRVARQRGMFLIEALVAVLLFMLGILGIVGVSGFAILGQSDAQYRTLAASLAGEMAQQAWLTAERSKDPNAATRAAVLRASLDAMQHQPSGDNCDFSGDKSVGAEEWVARVRAALPGATDTMQQVVVDSTAGGFNKVTVRVCWRVPSNPVPRQHVLATFVN